MKWVLALLLVHYGTRKLAYNLVSLSFFLAYVRSIITKRTACKKRLWTSSVHEKHARAFVDGSNLLNRINEGRRPEITVLANVKEKKRH